jgi:hypothetical protein
MTLIDMESDFSGANHCAGKWAVKWKKPRQLLHQSDSRCGLHRQEKAK